MAKQAFNKPPLGQQKLIDLMIRRGLPLNAPDQLAKARKVLSTLGYYRLSGYMLPYQIGGYGQDKHEFHKGTTLDQILCLYAFDTALRSHINSALELIEIAFRTSICDHMSRKTKSAHWILNAANFEIGKQAQHFEAMAKAVDFDVQRNKPHYGQSGNHEFITKYYERYNDPKLPASWMIRECASFGTWTKMFPDFLQGDKKQITDDWKFPDGARIDYVLLENWMHSLTILRNRCAHHSRITHRKFPFAPVAPKNPSVAQLFSSTLNDLRTLIALVVMLLRHIAPENQWLQNLKSIFDSHANNTDVASSAGFEKDYDKDILWEF